MTNQEEDAMLDMLIVARKMNWKIAVQTDDIYGKCTGLAIGTEEYLNKYFKDDIAAKKITIYTNGDSAKTIG